MTYVGPTLPGLKYGRSFKTADAPAIVGRLKEQCPAVGDVLVAAEDLAGAIRDVKTIGTLLDVAASKVKKHFAR